jgi:hypothetical protein
MKKKRVRWNKKEEEEKKVKKKEEEEEEDENVRRRRWGRKRIKGGKRSRSMYIQGSPVEIQNLTEINQP